MTIVSFVTPREHNLHVGTWALGPGPDKQMILSLELCSTLALMPVRLATGPRSLICIQRERLLFVGFVRRVVYFLFLP
jgi:hypothetical protein